MSAPPAVRVDSYSLTQVGGEWIYRISLEKENRRTTAQRRRNRGALHTMTAVSNNRLTYSGIARFDDRLGAVADLELAENIANAVTHRFYAE